MTKFRFQDLLKVAFVSLFLLNVDHTFCSPRIQNKISAHYTHTHTLEEVGGL